VVARGDAESRAVPVIVLCSPLSNEPARKRQPISCSRIVATPLAASASEADTPAGVRMDGNRMPGGMAVLNHRLRAGMPPASVTTMRVGWPVHDERLRCAAGGFGLLLSSRRDASL
jgi:hypothetical protein